MRNSTAAHWLLLLLLLLLQAITATTIWLFAGAQWDQSSIFRPTVQFLSLFDNFWRCTVGPKFNFLSHCAIFVIFWRFLTIFGGAQWDQSSIFRPTVQFLSLFDNFLDVHSGTKVQFSVPLCNFCHFLTIFGRAQWDQSSIFRPTVQLLSFFAVFWQFFGNFWWFSVNFWRFLSIFGDFWQFLVIFVNFWRFLTIFGDWLFTLWEVHAAGQIKKAELLHWSKNSAF